MRFVLNISFGLIILTVAFFPQQAAAQANYLRFNQASKAPEQSPNATKKIAIPTALKGDPQLEGLWLRYKAIEAAEPPKEEEQTAKDNKTRLFAPSAITTPQQPAMPNMPQASPHVMTGQKVINAYKQTQQQRQEMHSLKFAAPQIIQHEK